MKPARNWTAKVPDVIAPEAIALELETFLPYRLAVLASVTTQALAVVCASHGLSQTEWVILTAIAERPQTSAKAVGATFHMQKAKVSRAVSALLRQGHISASPNRDDRRLVELTLTPRGEALCRRCASAAADFSRRLEDALTAADREALARGLAKAVQMSLTFKAESAKDFAPSPELREASQVKPRSGG
jgi:DNA-binding MarR family transcriptional regulator